MNVRMKLFALAVTTALLISASAQAAPAAAPQRVAIAAIQTATIGSKVDVIGYFSHKSPEIDVDL